jgi:hypothetical protein
MAMQGQADAGAANRRFRLIELLCAAWIAVGAVVTLYVVFVLNVFSSSWGVPLGPSRLALLLIVGVAFTTPFAVLFISDQLRRPDWLAPRGRFVEGRKYSAFPPRRYIEIAFAAALILAFNNITLPFPGVSLVVIGLLFAASFFGPLTVYLSVWVAHLFGFVLGLPSDAGLGILGSLGTILLDGPIYAFAAWYFFKYVMPPRKIEITVKRLAQFVPWFASWNALHFLFWTLIAIPVWTGPAWYGFLITYVPTNYPTNILSGLIGAAAAEAAIRGTRRGPPAMAPAMTAGTPTPP